MIYDKAMSKNIIIINPLARPILASFLLFLKASGISSLAHTKIIAQAENDKKKGREFSIVITKIAPISPAIISTSPEA